MEKLCYYIKDNALCGLGQTAPNPVLSNPQVLPRRVYRSCHPKEVPRRRLQILLTYKITDACKGCTLCDASAPWAPSAARSKEKHVIDTDKCTKCGVCMSVCKFKAVIKE